MAPEAWSSWGHEVLLNAAILSSPLAACYAARLLSRLEARARSTTSQVGAQSTSDSQQVATERVQRKAVGLAALLDDTVTEGSDSVATFVRLRGDREPPSGDLATDDSDTAVTPESSVNMLQYDNAVFGCQSATGCCSDDDDDESFDDFDICLITPQQAAGYLGVGSNYVKVFLNGLPFMTDTSEPGTLVTIDEYARRMRAVARRPRGSTSSASPHTTRSAAASPAAAAASAAFPSSRWPSHAGDEDEDLCERGSVVSGAFSAACSGACSASSSFRCSSGCGSGSATASRTDSLNSLGGATVSSRSSLDLASSMADPTLDSPEGPPRCADPQVPGLDRGGKALAAAGGRNAEAASGAGGRDHALRRAAPGVPPAHTGRAAPLVSASTVPPSPPKHHAQPCGRSTHHQAAHLHRPHHHHHQPQQQQQRRRWLPSGAVQAAPSSSPCSSPAAPPAAPRRPAARPSLLADRLSLDNQAFSAAMLLSTHGARLSQSLGVSRYRPAAPTATPCKPAPAAFGRSNPLRSSAPSGPARKPAQPEPGSSHAPPSAAAPPSPSPFLSPDAACTECGAAPACAPASPARPPSSPERSGSLTPAAGLAAAPALPLPVPDGSTPDASVPPALRYYLAQARAAGVLEGRGNPLYSSTESLALSACCASARASSDGGAQLAEGGFALRQGFVREIVEQLQRRQGLVCCHITPHAAAQTARKPRPLAAAAQRGMAPVAEAW